MGCNTIISNHEQFCSACGDHWATGVTSGGAGTYVPRVTGGDTGASKGGGGKEKEKDEKNGKEGEKVEDGKV